MKKEELKERVSAISRLFKVSPMEYEGLANTSAVLKLIDQLGEPEMTIEQAWEVIGAEYGEELLQNNIEYVESNGYVVAKRAVIPKFVAEWVEENKRIVGLKHFFHVKNHKHEKAQSWTFENADTFARAWLDGYEVAKQPKWVVRMIAPSPDNFYFVEFIEDTSDPFSPSVSIRMDRAMVFSEKSKAEAVALLVGGTVEEVAE